MDLALTEKLKTFRDFLFGAQLKWYDIGIELGVSIGQLNIINTQYDNPADRLREMLIVRLRSAYPAELTWEGIERALRVRAINDVELADKGNKLYCEWIIGIVTHWCDVLIDATNSM